MTKNTVEGTCASRNRGRGNHDPRSAGRRSGGLNHVNSRGLWGSGHGRNIAYRGLGHDHGLGLGHGHGRADDLILSDPR